METSSGPTPAPASQAALAALFAAIAEGKYKVEQPSDVAKAAVSILTGPLRPVIEEVLVSVLQKSALGPAARAKALDFIDGPLFDLIALADGATVEEVATATTSCCSWLGGTSAPVPKAQ